MVISDFAIRRPMITVVTMVALVVFGLFALWRLQTDEFPDIQQPVVLDVSCGGNDQPSRVIGSTVQVANLSNAERVDRVARAEN